MEKGNNQKLVKPNNTPHAMFLFVQKNKKNTINGFLLTDN